MGCFESLVPALAGDAPVQLLEMLNSFFPPARTLLLPGDRSLEPLESPFGSSEVLRWRKEFAGAGDGQVGHAEVNAGNLSCVGERLRFYFTGEAGEPHAGLTPDGESFDLPMNRTVESDRHGANLGETETIAFQVETGLRIGETVIAPG